MAPEQLFGTPVTRRVDVFAAAVVLWEGLTGRRLFSAETEGEIIQKVTATKIEPPTRWASDISAALSTVVMKGLARDPKDRYGSAAEMAEALEKAEPPATRRLVAQWAKEVDHEQLAKRRALVADFERGQRGADGSGSQPQLPGSQSKPQLVADPPTNEASQPSLASSSALTVRGIAQDTAKPASGHRRLLVIGAVCAVAAAFAILPRVMPAVHPTAAVPAAATQAPPAPPPSEVPTAKPTAEPAQGTASSAPAADSQTLPVEALPAASSSGRPSSAASARPHAPRPRPGGGSVPFYSRD